MRRILGVILKQDRFAKLAVCITLSFGEGRVRIIRKPKPVWYICNAIPQIPQIKKRSYSCIGELNRLRIYTGIVIRKNSFWHSIDRYRMALGIRASDT